jgi:hypothetical protein
VTRWLLICVLLTGCAAKSKPQATLVIPVRCIREIRTLPNQCKPIDGTLSECRVVVVHDCVQTVPAPK